jgi:sugar porter (SP) family MFS transporter
MFLPTINLLLVPSTCCLFVYLVYHNFDTMTSLSQRAIGTAYKSHEGEHHGDYSDTSLKLTRHTYIFALCAAINSCNLGYDIGVSTHVGPLIQDEFGLSVTQRELFVGSLNFWSIFGSVFAHWICDKYGRRRSFIVAAVAFIVGVVMMGSSNSYTLLMAGRFFVGIGVGFGLAIDPLYIAEISPAAHRGELVTWSEIGINVGIVFGFSTGIIFYGYEQDLQWRLMIYMGALLPVIMIALVLTVMPESPRWLVDMGRDEEAKEVLQKVYPIGFDINPVVNDIKEAIEREEIAEQNTGWNIILFPTKAIQRMMLVGVGTAVAQQAVGIDAIQYYLIDLMKDVGIESEKWRLGILMLFGVLKLGFILVGGKLFDKRGRKPLLLISLAGTYTYNAFVEIVCVDRLSMLYLFFLHKTGMCASLVLIAFSTSGVAIAGLALYLSFFSIGMGPGAWLIPSEIFATSIRAKAMSVATFFNRITATLMSSTVLTTSDAIGLTGFFLLLAGVCLIAMAFIYFYLPETKGRSLEDMSLYFAEITNDSSLLEAELKIIEERKDTPAVGFTTPAIA